ncbi:MAG: hypothetical protein AAFV38_15450, partial [Pseudomonadota bacterium]
RRAIEGAVFGVFGGDTLLAEERLFDLAISARAQAAPRLTGLLRLLAKITRQGRDNHFSYSDDRFLANAALAYALAQALEASPQDPQLTGVLRRTYHEQDSLRLLLLGAVRWRSETGARGTRIHAYATDAKCWYSTGQARGAGADPTFQPESTYHAPLWASGGTVNKMIGSALDLRLLAGAEKPQSPSTEFPGHTNVWQRLGLKCQITGFQRPADLQIYRHWIEPQIVGGQVGLAQNGGDAGRIGVQPGDIAMPIPRNGKVNPAPDPIEYGKPVELRDIVKDRIAYIFRLQQHGNGRSVMPQSQRSPVGKVGEETAPISTQQARFLHLFNHVDLRIRPGATMLPSDQTVAGQAGLAQIQS